MQGNYQPTKSYNMANVTELFDKIQTELDEMQLVVKSLRQWTEHIDKTMTEGHKFGLTRSDIGVHVQEAKDCMKPKYSEMTVHRDNIAKLMFQWQKEAALYIASPAPLSNYGHTNDIDTSSVYTPTAA